MSTDDERWKQRTAPAVALTPEEVAATDAATQPEPSTVPSRPQGSRRPTSGRRERFHEVAELGRGGMGRVYEARDAELERSVAIKQALSDAEHDRQRFEREVRITAQLQHPNIVPVLDAGRDAQGRPYYVMRKIEGRPLADVIGEAKTTADRVALVPRILGAVDAAAYAHARGVIHRDIKSWNVLLGPYGETLLIDWGLALELERPTPDEISDVPSSGPTLTHAGVAFGSPGFMAPEQARGEKLDRRADVFALGAMLYHALSGERPLAKLSGDEAIIRAAEGEPLDLSEISDEVPRELVAIVAKATAVAAKDRYRDAGELAEDIRRFTAGQLVAAHTYSTGELVVRWLRRHRLAVAVGALSVVALVVVGVLAIRRVLAERDRADEARLAERDRADELLVSRAEAVMIEDPTRAVALLKQLPDGTRAWARASGVYDSAIARGVARGRLAHPGARTTWLAASPAGDVVVSGADSGEVVLHDPALRTPPKQLARLGEARAGVWFGTAVYVAGEHGELVRIVPDGPKTVLKATGIARLLATRSRLFSVDERRELREIDPETGAERRKLGTLSSLDTPTVAGDALIYRIGDDVLYHPQGQAPVPLVKAPAGSYLFVAVHSGGRRFAVATSTTTLEWDTSSGTPVERGHWTSVMDTLHYSENLLFGEIQGRFSILADDGVVYPRMRPFGTMVMSLSDDRCSYLSTNEATLWMVCLGGSIQVAGKTDQLMGLARAGSRLLGITRSGLLWSWDIGEINTQRVTFETPVIPAGFSGGKIWVATSILETIDLATGARLEHGQLALQCLTTRYAVVSGFMPSQAHRYEVMSTDTLKRTPLSSGFQGVTCARDGRVALLHPRAIELRQLAEPARPLKTIAIDHPPDRVVVEGDWMVVLTTATGLVERIDLRTDARTTKIVTGARHATIDANGRVAILVNHEAVVWTGNATPVPFASNVVATLAMPDALLAFTSDHSVVVSGPRGVHQYHGGTGYDPSAALDLPYVSLPHADGGTLVVDVRDGTERHYPLRVTGAWLDTTGTRVLGSTLSQGFVWPITNAGVTRTILEQATNATITPGSTRVTFPER